MSSHELGAPANQAAPPQEQKQQNSNSRARQNPRRRSPSYSEKAKSIFSTAGSAASSFFRKTAEVGASVAKQTVVASNVIGKNVQKLGFEKIKGMRSSAEEPEFLNKVTEVNNFFIFVKKLLIQSKRVQSARKEYMKIEEGLYTALGNTAGESSFSKSLRNLGQSHVEESTIANRNVFLEQYGDVYIGFLHQIIETDFKLFTEKKQEYDVSKINYDIATHNVEQAPNSQKREESMRSLELQTVHYTNLKGELSTLHETMGQTRKNLQIKMQQVEEARKAFLLKYAASLEKLAGP